VQESFLNAPQANPRETGKDALIGIGLLVVAFLILMVCAIPLAGIFWLVGHAGRYLSAHLGIPTDAWLPAFICVSGLILSIKNLRKRHWLSLLLSLAIIPTAMAAWLTGVSSSGSFLWSLPLWLVIVTHSSGRLSILQLVSAVLLAISTLLLILGMFGHTSLARALDDILTLALFAWVYFYYFRDQLHPVQDTAASGT
jgi:hypothetical protein